MNFRKLFILVALICLQGVITPQINKDELYKTIQFLASKEADKSYVYNLILIPAFTNTSDSMTVTIKEVTYFENSKEFAVKGAGSNYTIYPSITNRLKLDYSKPDFELPADAVYQAKVIFQSGNKTMYELPVVIDKKDK